jgi:hypothetical protein
LPAAAFPAERSLRLLASDGYYPGVPVFVRVEVREPDGSFAHSLWDAEAELTASLPGVTLTPARVPLRNGLGSALVAVAAPAANPDFEIRAAIAAEGLEAQRELRSLAAEPVAAVVGDVAGPLTEWSGVIHVTGNVTVPAGRTLRVLPGTLVLIDGLPSGENAPRLTVRGKLESLGTELSPVSFTARDPTRAWGEIRHEAAEPSLYRHTMISRAGNSPRGGHTDTGPAVRSTDSAIRFENSSISDTVGKSMTAGGSSLEFVETLLTRSVMGPEVGSTALIFERSYALEFRGTDDNDGIYLHDQDAGQVIRLTDSVFAGGDDDAIDTLGSDVLIEGCIVRDFDGPDADTKGISIFSGEVTIRRCLVVGNAIGVSAKGQSSGATVHIDRTTITDNRTVGIQADDKYGVPNLRIRIFVTSSIIREADAVRTDYPQFPDDIQIRFSDVSEPWSGEGNLLADPMFQAPAARDYQLLADSPCIDAGDPAADLDGDGTRADMGAFPRFQGPAPATFVRGRVNGDPSTDLSDGVAILLYLFAGGTTLDCADAADVNDDGFLNLTDAVYLLDALFRGGEAIAEPAGSCGADPTGADGLGCDRAGCS